jgi:putative transposase
MFVKMLDYKQEILGGRILKVPPHHTSRRCPDCLHTSKDNRKTQSRFECIRCGYADYVGALNILAVGHTVLACGDGRLRPSMKQELAENCEVVPLPRPRDAGIPLLKQGADVKGLDASFSF